MIDGFSLPAPRGKRWYIAAWWMPTLLMLAAPVLLASAVEWRVIVPWRQYLGVFPGDVALSVALGLSLYLLTEHLPVYLVEKRWYQCWWWQAWSVGFGLGFAGLVAYGEVVNTIYQRVPDAAYTWPQILSPTHLFHYVVVIVVGYIMWAVVVPMLVHVPRRFWLGKLVVVLLILAWALCALYLDNTLPRPDLGDVHPYNGGWFGPYGLKLWHTLA